MVKITWFHPEDRVQIAGFRHGSSPAELYLHLSERDIKKLMNFGQKGQVKPSSHGGGSLMFKGRFRIISLGKKKKKPSTKPKPAPPIPRGTVRTTTRAKPKKKRKSTGKLSAYNLFVKKHRLAGKSMTQIGALWRKKKR